MSKWQVNPKREKNMKQWQNPWNRVMTRLCHRLRPPHKGLLRWMLKVQQEFSRHIRYIFCFFFFFKRLLVVTAPQSWKRRLKPSLIPCSPLAATVFSGKKMAGMILHWNQNAVLLIKCVMSYTKCMTAVAVIKSHAG